MGESVNARVRGSQSRAAKSEEERMECRKRGERGGASRFGQDGGTCGSREAVCHLEMTCRREPTGHWGTLACCGRIGLEWRCSASAAGLCLGCREKTWPTGNGVAAGKRWGCRKMEQPQEDGAGYRAVGRPAGNGAGRLPGAHPNKKALR